MPEFKVMTYDVTRS